MAASSALAADDETAVARTAQVADWRKLGVGRLAPALSGRTLAGQDWSLASTDKSKAIVLAMTSSTCPVSCKYLPTLARLVREWLPRGVAFVLINSTEGEAPNDIRAQLAANDLSDATYVMDGDRQLAASLGASTTAEVFVLDASRTIVYRGAIDDQYSLGASLDTPRRTFLIDALNATLAGAQPAVRATTAPGCVLEPPATDSPRAQAAAITYHNRISRIVQDHCLTCHRAGGIGPFPLETYSQVKSRASMLKYVVECGLMPPWFAAPPADAAPGHASPWINDPTLPDDDRSDLLAWLSSTDKSEGDPADAPLPRTFPLEWSIGEPDAVLQLPKPIDVQAEGVMDYIHVRVDAGFDQDKWIQAIEVLPSARQVVHHILVFVMPKVHAGDRQRLREAIDEVGGFFAAYVPGNGAAIFPEGFAKLLPADSTLIFQMHYTPNGQATTDQTRIGLRFADAPPQHIVRVTGIAQRRINIPPNDPNHEETASLNVPFDVHVLGFMPHMHVRGKAFRYETQSPDGKSTLLLDVPHYDFNWQLRYEYRDPLPLKAGSKINVTAWYDNSAENPANPDPTQRVRWGPQTTDEMMLGYVEYYLDVEQPGATEIAGGERPRAIDLSGADRFDRLTRVFDRNRDGVIEKSEVPERFQKQFQALDRNGDGRVTRDEA